MYVVPVGVRGAWGSEIPRHDLIGYMNSAETCAVGVADDPDDAAAPILVALANAMYQCDQTTAAIPKFNTILRYEETCGIIIFLFWTKYQKQTNSTQGESFQLNVYCTRSPFLVFVQLWLAFPKILGCLFCFNIFVFIF